MKRTSRVPELFNDVRHTCLLVASSQATPSAAITLAIVEAAPRDSGDASRKRHGAFLAEMLRRLIVLRPARRGKADVEGLPTQDAFDTFEPAGYIADD